jgi:hypothetical protein
VGIVMDLDKSQNALFHQFEQAYWAIENVAFGSDGADGSVMVSFNFSAYPSRESKKAMEQLTEPVSNGKFGGPVMNIVESTLYRWSGIFRASDIFAVGIPVLKEEQLEILYPFVKSYLKLTDAQDVLEEGA